MGRGDTSLMGNAYICTRIATEVTIPMAGNGHRHGRKRPYLSSRQITRMIGVNHTYYLETGVRVTRTGDIYY